MRERRQELGWSQEALARHALVTTRTVARAEAGDDLKLSTAIALADALGVTMADLLGESTEQVAS